MAKAYSADMRLRVIGRVESGASRREAAEHYEVSPSTAVRVPSEGLVGIEGGVVSGVFNLESPGVRAPGRRPRHDQRYHEA